MRGFSSSQDSRDSGENLSFLSLVSAHDSFGNVLHPQAKMSSQHFQELIVRVAVQVAVQVVKDELAQRGEVGGMELKTVRE